jgi:hypothetical protein
MTAIPINTIPYLPVGHDTSDSSLKIGGDYLLPLNVSEYKGKYNLLSLGTLDDPREIRESGHANIKNRKYSYGCFPIKNGYVIDEDNYFGFGNRVRYNLFLKRLKDKIKEIKSW